MELVWLSFVEFPANGSPLCRMKVYMLRWRPKELCLLLITFMCATVLMWTFDGSSVLTPSLPAKNHLLLLSPGFFEAVSFLHSVHWDEAFSLALEIDCFPASYLPYWEVINDY
ncbi:hypothetical protein V6N11_062516 [Hibiscus sabdariffa]|uniref:Uncharacterized protein n=1 Tax=Hibiscus sabdariffa TaxID=183260 RepID=A0ABR2PSU8_9ROSI